MVTRRLETTRREDGAGSVRYQTPVTEADFDRLLKGHVQLSLLLKRYPPALSVVLVPARSGRRFVPADYEVRTVPFLIGPESQQQ